MNPTQVATYPTCIHGYVLLAKRDEPRIRGEQRRLYVPAAEAFAAAASEAMGISKIHWKAT